MNRLASEKSPYLLQHAHNPVDWYPWGEEAFARARREDRPIFLSVGYSTCHWCHVMARESFESPEVAAILNRDYVAIKVDREERPDVDRVYMTFVQATTGSGGWPMSVWLTPALEPFYGGTYFPPTSQWGRPGFAEILVEIARLWREDRGGVANAAHGLTGRLRALGRAAPAGSIPGEEALRRGSSELAAAFDSRHGGFGGAPKFPRPSELLFLLRESARTGDPRGRDMATRTLRAMAAGGIRDHLGGGFHRYSVDGAWRVPHFEKMLYDQAQLVLGSLEAAQATGDAAFANIAADTLAYVQRDMTDPRGGFFSAEDADSPPPDRAGEEPGGHGQEGAFYLWTDAEVAAVLGHRADLARARYGLRPGGNAPSDPQGEFAGRNLLYEAQSVTALAAATGRDAAVVARDLEEVRAALLAARAARPRPHLDDKILTGWNGLMIAAFGRAARVLPAFGGEPEPSASCLASARRAAGFIRDVMWAGGERRLWHRYRAGDAGVEAYAEDYAFLVFGLLELFQSDGDAAWLSWAVALQQRQDELFWDGEDGGWFSTTGEDPSVLLRTKEDYDGAEPSASAIAAGNLLVLTHLAGNGDGRAKIDATLRFFGSRIEQASRAVPMMLAVLSVYQAGIRQVVIVGPPGRADTVALRDALNRTSLPFVIQVPVDPDRREALARLLPFTASMPMRDGRATAYVCRDFACQAPVTDAADMLHQLNARRG